MGYSLTLYNPSLAFDRLIQSIDRLPKQKRDKFRESFLAFRLDGINGKYCTRPYVLGGSEPVEGRSGAVLFVCGANLFFASDAMVVLSLITMALGDELGEMGFSSSIEREVSYSLDHFRHAQQSLPFQTCPPAVRAYLSIESRPLKDCWSGILTYDVAMESLWRRIIQNSESAAGEKVPNHYQSSHNFPEFLYDLTVTVSQAYFDYVTLHEAAHLIARDPWSGTTAAIERAADEIAIRAIISNTKNNADRAIVATIQSHSLMYVIALSALASKYANKDKAKDFSAFNDRFDGGLQIVRCDLNTSLVAARGSVMEKLKNRLAAHSECER
jgi:hypothetical protein